MKRIKYILFLLVIFSIFSCAKNKSDTQPAEIQNSFSEKHPDVQNNFTETDSTNNKNPYTFRYFPEDDSYSWLNDLSYFPSEKPLVKSVALPVGEFSDLSPLILLPNLEELDIRLNDNIHDITPLASLVNLKKLTLIMCHNIESIKPISSLVNLKYLDLDFNDTYYKELAALQNLEYLSLSTSVDGTEEIDAVNIAKLSLLRELDITVGFPPHYLGRIRNINLLGNLVNLEVLLLYNVAPDISWVTGLKKLKKFGIREGYVEDLKPLLELSCLEEVYLAFSEIKDISVLLESKTIKKVTGPRVQWGDDLIERFAKKGIEYKESYSDR
jgi:Leucine-rich repeat (LRR) protein